MCIFSNCGTNSTQQQEGFDTFALSEMLVSWASSSSLRLFLSTSPSCSVWGLCIRQALCEKQWDCSFVIVIIFISPPSLRALSAATCLFFFFFFFSPAADAARLSGESAGFIGSLDCHGNRILGNLQLSEKAQRRLWVIFVRCIYICLRAECVVASWWRWCRDKLKTCTAWSYSCCFGLFD